MLFQWTFNIVQRQRHKHWPLKRNQLYQQQRQLNKLRQVNWATIHRNVLLYINEPIVWSLPCASSHLVCWKSPLANHVWLGQFSGRIHRLSSDCNRYKEHRFMVRLILFSLQSPKFIQPICAYRAIKGALANSVDSDQTPQNAASDQGLHCLN